MDYLILFIEKLKPTVESDEQDNLIDSEDNMEQVKMYN